MEFSALACWIEKKAMGRPLITRFAPSPTGYLHLGHVVNAIYVWTIAKLCGAKVVLRLEDHDRNRCKPIFESAILADLETLSFVPDIGTISEFRAGECDFRQSDSSRHYYTALCNLQSQQLVYACDCSRKRILARTKQNPADELLYDGHCRNRNLTDTHGMTLRVRMPAEAVTFEDGLQGNQLQNPAMEVGDFAIRDNHGNWTYQFAVVVDDMRHNISLIIRGMDILSSTSRQIILSKMLGQQQESIYLHHPLLVDATGQKLSKRDFSADIHSLLAQGKTRTSLIQDAIKAANLDPKIALILN